MELNWLRNRMNIKYHRFCTTGQWLMRDENINFSGGDVLALSKILECWWDLAFFFLTNELTVYLWKGVPGRERSTFLSLAGVPCPSSVAPSWVTTLGAPHSPDQAKQLQGWQGNWCSCPGLICATTQPVAQLSWFSSSGAGTWCSETLSSATTAILHMWWDWVTVHRYLHLYQLHGGRLLRGMSSSSRDEASAL